MLGLMMLYTIHCVGVSADMYSAPSIMLQVGWGVTWLLRDFDVLCTPGCVGMLRLCAACLRHVGQNVYCPFHLNQACAGAAVHAGADVAVHDSLCGRVGRHVQRTIHRAAGGAWGWSGALCMLGFAVVLCMPGVVEVLSMPNSMGCCICQDLVWRCCCAVSDDAVHHPIRGRVCRHVQRTIHRASGGAWGWSCCRAVYARSCCGDVAAGVVAVLRMPGVVEVLYARFDWLLCMPGFPVVLWLRCGCCSCWG
jgi:hypothetical protein